MEAEMLTRILRLLHVVQPFDFPGTPTMTGVSWANVKRDFKRVDTFHQSGLNMPPATFIYTEVFYIAT